MKKLVAVFMAMVLMTSLLAGCGTKEEKKNDSQTAVEDNQEDNDDNGESDEENTDFNGLGDVDVDEGLTEVSITVPADYIGDSTQEDLDKEVKEKGFISATLNADGSATYVMTKDQHTELMKQIVQSIDESLAEYIGSEDYPNITAIEANENYTSFTVTTKSTELSFMESFLVMGLYMYGGMYGIFSGEKVDNIHVDFVNADTGEIIDAADSKDMDDNN